MNGRYNANFVPTLQLNQFVKFHFDSNIHFLEHFFCNLMQGYILARGITNISAIHSNDALEFLSGVAVGV